MSLVLSVRRRPRSEREVLAEELLDRLTPAMSATLAGAMGAYFLESRRPAGRS